MLCFHIRSLELFNVSGHIYHGKCAREIWNLWGIWGADRGTSFRETSDIEYHQEVLEAWGFRGWHHPEPDRWAAVPRIHDQKQGETTAECQDGQPERNVGGGTTTPWIRWNTVKHQYLKLNEAKKKKEISKDSRNIDLIHQEMVNRISFLS